MQCVDFFGLYLDEDLVGLGRLGLFGLATTAVPGPASNLLSKVPFDKRILRLASLKRSLNAKVLRLRTFALASLVGTAVVTKPNSPSVPNPTKSS